MTYVVVYSDGIRRVIEGTYQSPRDAVSAELRLRNSGVFAWIEIDSD